jgi:F0F1-type ATP synthase gamma subunit
MLETSPGDLVEYLTTIWLGQKVFDVLQLSRLAEFAARTIHLEESSQRVKDIDRKLQLRYFRIRHEIIDQQMRELFTARSLFSG